MKQIHVLSFAVLVLLFPLLTIAQTDTIRPVHVGLVYPVSSNGVQAGHYTNLFSLHIIYGISKNENSLVIGGAGSVVKENVRGLQLSGSFSHAGDTVAGAQISGAYNKAGSVRGAQVSGFINLAATQVQGLQLAGFLNHSQQASMQVSGFMNQAKTVETAQIAGFINKSDVVGNQVAGFINIARQVKGVQLAGFINIAETSDYPIGPVNWIKNGEKGIGVTLDEMATTTLTLRSGGRVLYGLVGAGYNLRDRSPHYFSLEGGIGGMLKVSPLLRLKAELANQWLTDFGGNHHHKAMLRLYPSLTFGNRLELFAGPSINHTYYESDTEYTFVKKHLWKSTRGDDTYAFHLGFVGGLQVRF